MSDHNFNNTQAALTGASAPLKLNTTTYQFTPFTDLDMVELDNWVQEGIIDLAQRTIDRNPSKPPAWGDRLLRVAFREASSAVFASPEGTKKIGTIQGMARVVWQGIKAEHPDVTIEEIILELRGPGVLVRVGTRIVETVQRISAMLAPDNTEGGTDAGGKKSRQKKRKKNAKQQGRRDT